MVSIRFSALAMALVILTASSTSQAALVNKPYSPNLYDRDSLTMEESGNQMVKRMIDASRPYQPDLYSRESLEQQESSSFVVEKRSIPSLSKRSTSSSPATKATWNLFKRVQESEEVMHERGLIEDSLIESRGYCQNDGECGGDHYCSTKRHLCYRKIQDWNRCSRDGACASGYCCETEDVCKPKRPIGDRCHNNDGACDSGYCSVVSDRCHHQGGHGGKCRVDQGCKGELSCVNGSCSNPGSSQPSKPHHPSHPAPSGSAQKRRALTPIA